MRDGGEDSREDLREDSREDSRASGPRDAYAYTLFAVVNHIGTMQNGHYTCYVKLAQQVCVCVCMSECVCVCVSFKTCTCTHSHLPL
jgi:ubiquitin C-terminal hydrolase